jgi:hypothetical protein
VHAPFARPPPKTLDPLVLADFNTSFSAMQDFSCDHDTIFDDRSSDYVAVIPDAFVEGEGGLVSDSRGRSDRRHAPSA